LPPRPSGIPAPRPQDAGPIPSPKLAPGGCIPIRGWPRHGADCGAGPANGEDKDMGMDPSMGMSKENLGPQSSQGGVMLAVALHVWASASAGPVAGEGVPHQEHQKHAPTRPHRLPSECGHGPSRMNATAHQQIASPVDHSESAQGGQFRPSCHELLHVLSTSDHNQSSKPQTAPRAMSPAWRSDADADLLVAWPSPGPQAYH